MVGFPKDFTPQSYDIIIGRGRRCFNHVGNQELRRTVASRLVLYLAATSQKDKTEIISSVLEELRDRGINFVKLNPRSEKWFDVGDHAAREKISQTFRDALHEKYRSSTGYKMRKKQEKKRLNISSRKGSGFGSDKSHQRPVGCKGDDNQNLTHTNESSQVSSKDIVRSYMPILPFHLIDCENPHEPAPIDFFEPRSSTGYKMRKKQEKKRLNISSRKGSGFGSDKSHQRPVGCKGDDNQNLTHTNESSQVSSKDIVRSYMYPHEPAPIDFFEPTPIDFFQPTFIDFFEPTSIDVFEPTPIVETPWRINTIKPGGNFEELDRFFCENMPAGFYKN